MTGWAALTYTGCAPKLGIWLLKGVFGGAASAANDFRLFTEVIAMQKCLLPMLCLVLLLLSASAAFAGLVKGFYPGWEKYRRQPVVSSPDGASQATVTGGSTYTDPTTGMEFVFVKGGCFQMGDTFGDGEIQENPVHEVCVDDFYMGKHEVTQGEWQKVMGSNPAHFKKGDRYPVEQVSWTDVQDYLRKLNGRSGKNYRLPTEAEWEYAARSGGKQEKYAGGDSPDGVAWYNGNSGGSTHPVGQKRSNGLGLYDMSGNVMELCSDWYGYYGSSPRDNPQGPSSGSYRVARGGNWGFPTVVLRSAHRYGRGPGDRSRGLGFRLVLPTVQ
jgi:formylglycine-generating enzyme required for sulfatase activity